MGFIIIFRKFANLVPANRKPSPVIEATTFIFFEQIKLREYIEINFSR